MTATTTTTTTTAAAAAAAATTNTTVTMTTNDRYYIRELIEDVDGEDVIATTHYGQLRGVTIKGIPAAGQTSQASS